MKMWKAVLGMLLVLTVIISVIGTTTARSVDKVDDLKFKKLYRTDTVLHFNNFCLETPLAKLTKPHSSICGFIN